MAEKKSLTQIAQDLGLHPNTIKNYQKAGKLPSAEKVRKPGGGFSWIVDETEVIEAAKAGRSYEQPASYHVPDKQEQSTNNTDSDSRSTNDSGPGTVLMALQQERERLLDRVFELERQLQDSSFERGRLESLERQLDRMEGDRGGLVRAIGILFTLLILALIALVVIILILQR